MVVGIHLREVVMAAKLGDALYWFFCAVAGAWVTLITAGFTWHTISLYQGFFGLGLAAVSSLIGYALRYILAGTGTLFHFDVMSKFNRDS
jgi:hypothetical protein